MEDRREKGRRVEFESQRDGDRVGDEERDVEQEKNTSDREATAEIPGDWNDQYQHGYSETGKTQDSR